jgi:hypothetical protein|tara:strand:- start:249 stop:392 length:144 start_codon:yes stop_codon:yes gene_type:complete
MDLSSGRVCDPYWQEAFEKARRAGSNGFPTLLKNFDDSWERIKEIIL